MKKKFFIGSFIFMFLFLLACIPSRGEIKLPRLIRDSMVLQRDTKIRIWGWGNPGEKIRLKFTGKEYKTTTLINGEWSLILAPTKAGGPYTMNIDGSNHLLLKEILVGDVWICSGQSNMVLPMERVKEKYPFEIQTANYPEIRHFFIPTLTDLQKPKNDLPAGSWKSANPTDVLQFSATAFFFARAIYEKYHIPIGLINASVGGTPIEAWISEDGLKQFPTALATIEKNKDTAYINGIVRQATVNSNRQQIQSDKGLIGKLPWYDTSYIPTGWHRINIPGYWEDQGVKDLDGVVWYRKEFEIPPNLAGIPAKLFMGRIIDADHVYLNGKLVGNITYQYPPRRYAVPAGLLKAGWNTMVIRVVNYSGKGGFVPDKPYNLKVGEEIIDLKGEWQYKVGEVYVNRPTNSSMLLHYQPTALFNAMIGPLTNYSIKGFIWYQGEANTSNPGMYKNLLPRLITDWRNRFQGDNLPFLYVQLPNFMDVQYVPSESQWAVLRESQLKTLSVPNTAMTVAIDLGEWNDIHPLNKREVGERLALGARKIAYGENALVHSGPIFQSFSIEGNKVILQFTNTGGGLVTNDQEEPSQFAIAGADKKFVWARARIDGNKIIAWSDEILNPLYVRYAWADNPENPNLYNKEGLPASPFRTDEN